MKTDSRLGGERRYIGTVELRSWYSGSDEIDFVVGSRVRRGKERRASLVLLLFPKGGPLADLSGAPSGDWGIVRATQFHSKRQIRAKIVPAGSGEKPLWRVKMSSDYSLFALLRRQSVGAFLYYDALSP
jgi:hypothetical protein